MKKYLFISLFAFLGCGGINNGLHKNNLSEREKLAKYTFIEIINDSTINVKGKNNIMWFSRYCGCDPHTDRDGFAGFHYHLHK